MAKTNIDENEVLTLKRALGAAYTEIALNKRKKEEAGEAWESVRNPHINADELKKTVEVSQTARDLEESGVPFPIAWAISEAVQADDFETAQNLMHLHEQNERTKDTEAEENSVLRKWLGLA